MTTQTYVTTRLTTVSSKRHADLDNAHKGPGRPRKLQLVPKDPEPPTQPKPWVQRFGIESECFKGLVFVEGMINREKAESLIKELDHVPWDETEADSI